MKQNKHISFPLDLIKRIDDSKLVPKYLDFTTKVFMLLELALKTSGEEPMITETSAPKKPKELVKDPKSRAVG